jgi:hypothetical protein
LQIWELLALTFCQPLLLPGARPAPLLLLTASPLLLLLPDRARGSPLAVPFASTDCVPLLLRLENTNVSGPAALALQAMRIEHAAMKGTLLHKLKMSSAAAVSG